MCSSACCSEQLLLSHSDLMVLCFLFLFSLKDPCHFDVWAHPSVMAHRIHSGSKCFWSHLLLWWSSSLWHYPQRFSGILISIIWQGLNQATKKSPSISCLVSFFIVGQITKHAIWLGCTPGLIDPYSNGHLKSPSDILLLFLMILVFILTFSMLLE